MMNLQRKLLLSCGAALGALAAASGAFAQQRAFDIPAQPATKAVPEFARQAGVQIITPGSELRGLQSQPLKGEFDVRAALGLMLAGTGLAIESDDGAVIVLRRADQSPQGGSAGADVDALIVTAQKREENIQDVPIAISAFSQEDLTTSQIAGGPDLMTQVPNMTFTKTNFASYSIQIRGIGTQAISATTDPAVAVAFNNTPFVRNHFFEQEFYDLQRVEVLRGPQGTLYGRNATAGVVNVISAKPAFDYEAKLSADIANYSSTRLEGMVNLPLVDDLVALRLAGAWTKREGFVTNQNDGEATDGRDLWSTRVSLRIAPTDRLEANLIWEHFEEDDDRLRSGKQLCNRDARTEQGELSYTYQSYNLGTPGGLVNQGCLPASLYSPDSFQAPNGFSLPYYHPLGVLGVPIFLGDFDPYLSTTQSSDLRVIESTVDPRYRAKSDTFQLQIDYDLSDNLTLTSETAYGVDELFSTQDFNRFNTRPGAFNQAGWDGRAKRRAGYLENGIFCDPQVGCADRLVAMDLSTAQSRQFSQEFRIGSDFDGPLNFSVGANFLRYDTEDKYYVFINTLTMYAALGGPAGSNWDPSAPFFVPPWEANGSDNSFCFIDNGFAGPDPNKVQPIDGCTYIDPNPVDNLDDRGHNYFLSRNPYKLISYAAFGEAYYNVTDTLKVTAGLRWTVDKKEAPRIPSWLLAAGSVGYPVAEVIEQEWRKPTGRLTIDWKPDLAFTDETLLYASYARGYKAGGANPPGAGLVVWLENAATQALQQQSTTAPKTFEAEFVNAFELGAKNTLFGGAVTLNASAFYYDYTNYQISYIVNRSAVNLNFDADVWGLEIEADWRPLDNLKLGFKGGYESTRVADGESAVDMMDRNNGGLPDENGIRWAVMRPFPTFPSNCIVPLYTLDGGGGVMRLAPNSNAGGNIGYCESAYALGLDPVTMLPYVPDPTDTLYQFNMNSYFPGYKGFNPATAPNNGEGISKDLSGNKLPNAPDFTASITVDYTLPLPNDWLMTLHSDLYYQSEAWTRIFNTEGYDKLKAYSNINLAAIFTNEDAGWKVMAYVKNVLDRDSITGAFLNSDDTGLTTNVFLTEPRLYGLRVTKDWSGVPGWLNLNAGHDGVYPLTIEIGGQVQRQDAPYEPISARSFADIPLLDTQDRAQNRDLDWGAEQSIKLSYRPQGSPWVVSGGVRYGRINNDLARYHAEYNTVHHVCAFAPPKYSPSLVEERCSPTGSKYTSEYMNRETTSASDVSARNREEHTVVDFAVGRDLGLGGGLSASSVGLGIRYADFQSQSSLSGRAFGGWVVAPGWSHEGIEWSGYNGDLVAEREFTGAGPVLSWSAAVRLLGGEDAGALDLDWTVAAGALFGDQQTAVSGRDEIDAYSGSAGIGAVPISTVSLGLAAPRSRSVTVPLVDLSVGLSYQVQRFKIGAGYRWERYFDVLDVGQEEAKDGDRTIDGPYLKIAVGLGG